MRFETLAEWLVWQEALHPKSIDLGLARVKRVFTKLGQGGRVPLTITVGGTNGKGSCVAMLDTILREAGYRVATYTSPHLLRYNERIRLGGRPVEDERICEAFTRVDRARGDTTLSFFEFGTLAALSIFAEEELDVQVLEVGLGGRLDAVNIIDAAVALIASIDIDHTEWLGDTRDAIGLEKAGIFRSGRPAVVGDPETPASMIRFAASHDVPLHRLGADFGYRIDDRGWTWYNRESEFAHLPCPPLAGEHQLMNASAVLETLHLIADQRPVSVAAIREGLSGFELPGRFQFVPGDVPVLLDVAHNPQAVKILASELLRHFSDRRIHAVFACMRDKDVSAIVGHIKHVVDDWYLAPLTMARAATDAELLEIFRIQEVAAVHCGFPSAADAFAAARRDARGGGMILAFGSFFLVSEYLAQYT